MAMYILDSSSVYFRCLLQMLGETVTKSFLKAMVKEVDSDMSGEVDFDEFCIMLLGILKGKRTELSAFRERFSSAVEAGDRKAWFQRVREQYLQKKKTQKEASDRALLSGAAVGEKNMRKMRKLKKLQKMHEPSCLCGCRSLAKDPDYELVGGVWKNISRGCAMS
jgi:hypothetical protein